MNAFKAAICAVSALILTAEPAFAGPVLEFGPENQGTLQLDYKGQFQMRVRDTGAGVDADGTATEFGFRRNRLALMGSWGEHLGIYVQTEFLEDNNITALDVTDGEGPSFQLLDAALRFSVNDQLNVWVGKFKYGFTRENLEACEAPLTLDRSLFIRAPYVSTRDQGVSVWGNVLGGLVQYRADAMNGRNDSASTPESQFRYSARLHVSLLDPENAYGYKGTYLGLKKVFTVGGAFQYEPGVAFADTAASTGSVDYTAWTVDGFLEYPVAAIGTFTASGAYVKYDLDEAFAGAVPDAGSFGLNGEKNGWYAKAAYMLPNVPLQVFGRVEQWSFARLENVFDQDVAWYGGGLNYYARGQDLKITAEYSATVFDQTGVFDDVRTEDLNTFVLQLQLVF